MSSLKEDSARTVSVCCHITGEVLYTLPDIRLALAESNASCEDFYAAVNKLAAKPRPNTATAAKQPNAVKSAERTLAKPAVPPRSGAGATIPAPKQPVCPKRGQKPTISAEWFMQQQCVEQFLVQRKKQPGMVAKLRTAVTNPSTRYWQRITTEQQKHILTLYNTNAVPFPSDRMLEESATDSGICVTTALLLHLAYELSYPLADWLGALAKTAQHTTEAPKQPGCFSRLYKYFKKCFPPFQAQHSQLLWQQLKQQTATSMLQSATPAVSANVAQPLPGAKAAPLEQQPFVMPAPPQSTAKTQPAPKRKVGGDSSLISYAPLDMVRTSADIDICGEHLPKCKKMRSYCCHHCCTHTNNPRMYLLHMRDVHGCRNTIYLCPSCQYATKRSNEFVRHMQALHRFSEEQAYTQKLLSALPYDGIPQKRRRRNTNTAPNIQN